jgi:prolyl-tRNA synthetase
MRMSRYFLPTLKETPKEAEIVSHRLMLRAGMIKQTSAGIYAWLPLGLRVLQKIGDIVRKHQGQCGSQELLMPTLQPADLWRESGRYEDYGKEMLRIQDRQGRDLLYGPTNEEMITDIFRTSVRSYKDLPKNLYHIQWKFRDEVRPRFGVMRGREFLMKDGYSFDLDFEGAQRAYRKIILSYLRTFNEMGLEAYPMRAETGPIGGDLSHEFIILAETGESEVFADRKWKETDVTASGLSYDDDEALQDYYKEITSIYTATDEMHDPESCPVPDDQLLKARGIEVGHIFYFGTKYSKAMNAVVQNRDGDIVPVEMGSYGIGVSRLVGALIEAGHDDAGIIWPESVAPFRIGIINLKPADEECTKACDDLYAKLEAADEDVLYEDRDERAGVKFADMDLIGIPWQIVIGPRGLREGTVELKCRKTGEKEELSLDSALAKLGVK